ncbi:FxSxx-COOH cyclophane-containing RiPP peptide [Streptomyces sp. NBC_01618]|uniref:FxSxx-COOH cyclophane-containing RiPP peptide n=1 Tax=Streptomyces sp. NBC_01618 TaxID=2975900 RepID=UPI003870B641|nr:FxSxx-COOH protein [Streptomyces sp. NBC_01618]
MSGTWAGRDALNGERVTAGSMRQYVVRGGVMSESIRDGGPGGGASGGPDALPDLLEIDLEALRTMDHPVLSEVVADLRGRAEQPREMLWGFQSAF